MSDSQSRDKPANLRRSRPIVFYLVVLALVAFVPVMAFAAVLLQRNNEAQQEIVQTLILATTQAIGQAVDQQTEGMITALKGFSSAPMSSEAERHDLYTAGTYALAGTGSFLVLIDSNYQQVFNTRLPYGAPLGKASNAEALQRALDTGEITVSNTTFGTTANAWVVECHEL